MSTQLDMLKNRLFGEGGLMAGNIKLYPGSNREVTAEQVAEQLNRALTQLETGDTKAEEI